MEDHVIAGKSSDLEKERLEKMKEKIPSTINGTKFLQTTKVNSLFPEGRISIVSVEDSDSIAAAFKLLVENKILSVPVYDRKRHMFTAFIDMLDIVTFCLKGLEQAQTTISILDNDLFIKNNCKQVAESSGRNLYYAVDRDAPLLTAIEAMVQYKVHRIPAVDHDGVLQTIITQSSAIQLLSKNLHLFKISESTINDLKLGIKNVYTINHKEKAIEAFKLIYSQKVSGIGVVNDSGELIGNISASDLQLVGYDTSQISRLFLPTEEFLRLIPQRPHHVQGVHCLGIDATFKDVILKFAQTRTHRIYLVDSKKKPIGVISLVDALEAILKSKS